MRASSCAGEERADKEDLPGRVRRWLSQVHDHLMSIHERPEVCVRIRMVRPIHGRFMAKSMLVLVGEIAGLRPLQAGAAV